ncbi:hypothetical protein C7H19_23790 [Aphanothece hegewaldii CCALA 016]|uniref:Uncharacterized protein n=1 Tax=Aphanothece hegewaldii CCALA 016 TaxID=2107694 RepID=A0A2T1LR15_9CHRO|nr:hypothetical protein [Aphanothece hegewaldii]PSF30537.1 hypothetical protein C7H19_23790 [Aphanothece hegewaldii CCALA 016]
MVDFRKAVQEKQIKNGYCSLPQSSYATVKGKRINCVTNQATEVDLPYLIILEDHQAILKFLNGVTGAEAYYINEKLFAICEKQTEAKSLCAGTPQRWDRLTIPIKSLEKILLDYKYFHR